jgi:TRAP-type uncharacterized transport system substrate-binding protein
MSKKLTFSRFALLDFLLTAGPPIVLIVLVCWLAYRWIDPTPPTHVTMATGQENSAYDVLAKRYVRELAKHHIEVTLVPSAGSLDNLQKLAADDGKIDIGFVQSGSSAQIPLGDNGLVSLGSLFTEPVWLFYRSAHEITGLHQLRGKKINVGPEGSGLPGLFRSLLEVNGMTAASLHLGALDNTAATVELLAGRIDGVVFSSAPDGLLIQMLLQTPGVRLLDFAQAEAYTRRYPFLTHVTLPRGIVNLGRDVPLRDYQLIAPTATLVARAGLHPALVELFVQAAADIHGGPGWFHKKGDFPTASYNEIEVAPDAKKFYLNGPSLLQRHLPFWLANLFERMWGVIVALGVLLLPLSRIVPPLYVWKVRSRVYSWYGKLRAVEHALEDVTPANRAQLCAAQLKQLNEIEEKVNQISIPLSFAEELYGLRSHINFVRLRILALQREGEPAIAPPAVSGAQPGQAGLAPAA